MAFDSDQQDTPIIKQEKYVLDKISVQKIEKRIVQSLFSTKRRLTDSYRDMSYILKSSIFPLK